MSVLDFLDDELAALAGRGRLRSSRVVRGAQGTRIRLDGRDVVSFSSNDYLGLAAHPALREAAMAEIDRSGVGAGASRLIVGNQEAHVSLELALAELFRCESALLFSSGYAANTGVLAVLAEAPDAIFSDSLNHASIIDGCRLSRATVHVFRHQDLGALQVQLAESTARRKVIVTESVFSMDGDLADLGGLRALADQYQAILVVDEAHAVGTLGPHGGGALELLDLRADVVIGTLGKALGAAGACVAGPTSLTRLLWNRARPLIFSTSMPALVAAAARVAVELVRGPVGFERRAQLHRNCRLLADSLVPRGTTPMFHSGSSVPRGTPAAQMAAARANEMVPRGTGSASRRDLGSVPRGTESRDPGSVPRGTGSASWGLVPRGMESRDPGSVPRGTESRDLGSVPRGMESRDPGSVPRGTGTGSRGSVPRGTDGSGSLGSGGAESLETGRVTADGSPGGIPGTSPIIPLVVGDDREVMRWTEYLLERGVFVQGIRPPTVPEGTARLRIAVSAGHEEHDLAKLIDAIGSGRRDGLRLQGDE